MVRMASVGAHGDIQAVFLHETNALHNVVFAFDVHDQILQGHGMASISAVPVDHWVKSLEWSGGLQTHRWLNGNVIPSRYGGFVFRSGSLLSHYDCTIDRRLEPLYLCLHKRRAIFAGLPCGVVGHRRRRRWWRSLAILLPLCDRMAADVLFCTTVYRSNRMLSMCCPPCACHT